MIVVPRFLAKCHTGNLILAIVLLFGFVVLYLVVPFRALLFLLSSLSPNFV